MIERLRLWNWQTHLKLDIELDEFVTFIIGPTFHGKSSIIRALYWLCLSRPSGISFINHNKDKCKVELTVDGHIVVRTRGRTKPSRYYLDGKLFQAAGVCVPDAVAGLLNVSPANFQRQLDSPYWITDSPGEMARNLNAVINLDAIDKSLFSIASRIRKQRTVVEVTEERVQTLQEKVKSLSWAEEFHADVTALEELRQEYKNALERSQSLHHTISRVRALRRQRRRLLGPARRLSALLRRADKLRREGRELAELEERQSKLARLVKQAKSLQQQKADLEHEIREKTIQLQKVKRCPLCRKPFRSTHLTCI